MGAFTGIHQFCRVGLHAFIGGYSVITRDALPFVKTVGDRNDAKTYDINSIGLERRGFSRRTDRRAEEGVPDPVSKGLRVPEAVRMIRSEGLETEDVGDLIRFIETSERGFIR